MNNTIHTCSELMKENNKKLQLLNNRYCIITPNCTSFFLYRDYFQYEYNHPFVNCCVADIKKYIDFCNNFETYINTEPKWYLSHNNKPVMNLNGIKIEYIHHLPSEIGYLQDKYNERLKRFRQGNYRPFFVCWNYDGDWNDKENTVKKEYKYSFKPKRGLWINETDLKYNKDFGEKMYLILLNLKLLV